MEIEIESLATHLHLLTESLEQCIGLAVIKFVDLDLGETVFAVVALCDLSSKVPGEFLIMSESRE